MTVAALRALIDAETPAVVRPPAPRIRPRTQHPEEVRPVNTQQAVAVSMYRDGETVAAIIDATGLDQDEIADAVRNAGHEYFAEPQNDGPTDAVATTAQGLIAWGMQHPSPRMQRLADQARTALADLQQARRREAVVTAAEERVRAAEQALAAARDALRAAKGAPAPAGRPDRAEAAAIRIWARDHGHTVGAAGMIPRAVVDAYRDAQAA
ncbi:histone-like nucleoid-structuring protein Lsr2 [Kitasatospora sp. NPDC059646]|uniref:Lsr2 family DNA-binding protein n=1 Tax=Kitasatospora sp. NPDC059646 TaxID=3346893 RepID=UPI0036789447